MKGPECGRFFAAPEVNNPPNKPSELSLDEDTSKIEQFLTQGITLVAVDGALLCS
jgi:hypothetical protein